MGTSGWAGPKLKKLRRNILSTRHSGQMAPGKRKMQREKTINFGEYR